MYVTAVPIILTLERHNHGAQNFARLAAGFFGEWGNSGCWGDISNLIPIIGFPYLNSLNNPEWMSELC